jgi:wyosine [tRNA(Phe)-imidazoG37] synthetase (radical SAM superfamily)
VRLTILSNASTAHLPHIREALAGFEAPIMKLDAGDPGTLAGLNRPAPAVKLARILEGLKGVPGLIVQSVLVEGRVSNARGEAFEAWLAALAELRPTGVQIYSTDRPVPEAGVERVPPAALRRIAGEIQERTGLRVDAYWA